MLQYFPGNARLVWPRFALLVFKLYIYKLHEVTRGNIHLGGLDAIVLHDDVIKWKHFPRCRPFVRGIHRSPVNSPHRGR